jgi:XTP/dITP diphosphohydrolase
MSTLLLATRNAHKAREIQQILGADFQCLTLNDFPGAPAVVEDAPTFAGNAAKKADGLADWLLANPEAIFSPTEFPSGAFYVLADDSGLEVDALDGAPGVHSARFAGLDSGTTGNSSDSENNAKLLRLLREVPLERRTARFHCVLAWRELVLSTEDSVAARIGTTRPSRNQTERGQPCPREFVVEKERADKAVRARKKSSRNCAILTDCIVKTFEGACEGRISFSPSGGGGFGYDPLFVPDGHSQSFAELGDAVKNGMSHRSRALQKLKEYLTNR